MFNFLIRQLPDFEPMIKSAGGFTTLLPFALGAHDPEHGAWVCKQVFECNFSYLTLVSATVPCSCSMGSETRLCTLQLKVSSHAPAHHYLSPI